MHDRTPESAFPWAGLITLGVAAVTAALLMAGPFSVREMLQTWELSRSAGIVAYLLLWASVCLGLLQAAGLFKRLTSAAARVDIHEFLSVGALHATVFHVVILMWNQHVTFGWREILVPFTSDYSPGLVGIGGVSFYLALIATVTTYLRKWLSPKLWRSIHLLTLVGFLFALLHGVALGPDTQAPAVWLMYVGTGISVALLGVARLVKGVLKTAHPAR